MAQKTLRDIVEEDDKLRFFNLIKRNKYDIDDETSFKKLIKNSFLMKRKTFVNNVIKSYNVSREEVENYLISLNLPINCRAEDLTVENFIKLSKVIK